MFENVEYNTTKEEIRCQKVKKHKKIQYDMENPPSHERITLLTLDGYESETNLKMFVNFEHFDNQQKNVIHNVICNRYSIDLIEDRTNGKIYHLNIDHQWAEDTFWCGIPNGLFLMEDIYNYVHEDLVAIIERVLF